MTYNDIVRSTEPAWRAYRTSTPFVEATRIEFDKIAESWQRGLRYDLVVDARGFPHIERESIDPDLQMDEGL